MAVTQAAGPRNPVAQHRGWRDRLRPDVRWGTLVVAITVWQSQLFAAQTASRSQPDSQRAERINRFNLRAVALSRLQCQEELCTHCHVGMSNSPANPRHEGIPRGNLVPQTFHLLGSSSSKCKFSALVGQAAGNTNPETETQSKEL